MCEPTSNNAAFEKTRKNSLIATNAFAGGSAFGKVMKRNLENKTNTAKVDAPPATLTKIRKTSPVTVSGKTGLGV